MDGKDLLIGLSIGGTCFMMVIMLFGSYSPTTAAIAAPYQTQFNATYYSVNNLTNSMSTNMTKINVNPDPVSSLASALGGIAILTINLGTILLSTLFIGITGIPQAFFFILFGFTSEVILTILPPGMAGFAAVLGPIQVIVLAIITISILMGIFMLLTGKKLEF